MAQPALLSGTEDSLSVKHYLRLAREVREKNPVAALSYATKALTLSRQLSYKPGIAFAESELGFDLLLSRQLTEALDHFAKAKPLLQDIQDDELLARVLKSMGDAYSAQSYFRQAFDHYREAAPLLRKTGQLKLLNECQDAMGNLSLNFGQPKGAITMYKRSLIIKTNLNDLPGMLITNTKLSNIYLSLKQYDSALYFNREAQRLATGDAKAQAGVKIDELNILSFQGKLEEAAAAKQQAERLSALQANSTNTVKLLVAISNYYLARNDKELSGKYFDSAAALVEKSKNVELAVTGLGLMAEMSSQHEDFKTAFRMIKLMDRYKDIFRTENMERISAEIKNTAEASLKEKEIEYLNLSNKLKAEQLSKEELKRLALLQENILKDSSIANQRTLMAILENESALKNDQLRRETDLRQSLSRENTLKQKLLIDERKNKWLLWLGIGILTLSGAVIYNQYRKQRAKNAIIRKQSAELEVLNKEIHHRVKNNLQVISSMLDLQSQSLNDEKAAAIIREGIQRVQSMAFIHQNLYQGNVVNSVNMNEYIKMLSNHLFQTYNIRTDKIRLHTRIEDLNLHTDTAIPLGMILNELISNALKYAFINRDGGDIQVDMKRSDNELLLQVRDNGVGLPTGFDPNLTTTFGYEIIRAFSQKLKARMNVDGSNGTDVQIIISKFKTIS